MINKFLLILVGLLTSCGSAMNTPTTPYNSLTELPHTMSIALRANATEDELRIFQESLDFWNNAIDPTDPLLIEDKIGYNIRVSILNVKQIVDCPHTNDSVNGCAILQGDNYCTIDIANSAQFTVQLVEHEIGHCVGFNHVLDSHSIMFPDPQEGAEIGDESIQLLRDIRL